MSLSDLPLDVLHLVASLLPPPSLLSLARTSKYHLSRLSADRFCELYCRSRMIGLTLPPGVTWFQTAIRMDYVVRIQGEVESALKQIGSCRGRSVVERCRHHIGRQRCTRAAFQNYLCSAHGGTGMLLPYSKQFDLRLRVHFVDSPRSLSIRFHDATHPLVHVDVMKSMEVRSAQSHPLSVADFLHLLVFDGARSVLGRPCRIASIH